MKNNKGFTLIEVLAVVAILVTIIMIITPKVFKQFKTAENVTDKEQINAIINTAQIYMNQNSNLLPSKYNIYIISLNELKDSGLIKTSQILNPSTKQEIKGCVIVKYENNKYNYIYKEENECNNAITVTFDPDGGTLQETTKQALYHDTYGELPIPTKEGYTFMGWNGKNILDKSQSVLAAIRNETPITAWGGAAFNNDWIVNVFESGKTYSISYDIECISIAEYDTKYSDNLGFLIYSSTKGTLNAQTFMHRYLDVGEKTHHSGTFTVSDSMINSENGYNILLYTNRYLKNNAEIKGNIRIYNLQIEEGNTATEYEPYYITSDTKVVQQENHTLKAIWQANS